MVVAELAPLWMPEGGVAGRLITEELPKLRPRPRRAASAYSGIAREREARKAAQRASFFQFFIMVCILIGLMVAHGKPRAGEHHQR
jgi:hypothetical protein